MLLFPENQPGLEQGSHPEGSNQSFWPVSGTQPTSSVITENTKARAWPGQSLLFILNIALSMSLLKAALVMEE